MAFDFADLFPDTPAAAKAGQGAMDIVTGQDKAAANYLNLEDALTATAARERNLQNSIKEAPLQKIVDAVNVIKNSNIVGNIPSNVDISNPEDLGNYLLNAPKISNAELELQKSKLNADAISSRQAATQKEINDRAAAERAADKQKQADKSAFDYIKPVFDQYKKIPKSSSGQQAILAHYRGLSVYGSPNVQKVYWRQYQPILEAAGETPPGGIPVQKPKAPAAPQVQPQAPAPQVQPPAPDPSAQYRAAFSHDVGNAAHAVANTAAGKMAGDAGSAIANGLSGFAHLFHHDQPQSDPLIAQYAKQYNLDYTTAETVLRKRGYQPK